MPKLFTFIVRDAHFSQFQTPHLLSIVAETEQQARSLFTHLNLVFVSRKPLSMTSEIRRIA